MRERERLSARMVLSVFALVVVLSGCASQADPSSAESESQAKEARERAASECLDLWLDTRAPQSVVDSGVALGVITNDPLTGKWHASESARRFDEWSGSNNVPWERVTADVLYGPGCRFMGVYDGAVAVLPSDPLCGVVPVGVVTPMLTAGTYVWGDWGEAQDPVSWDPDTGALREVSCSVHNLAGDTELFSVLVQDGPVGPGEEGCSAVVPSDPVFTGAGVVGVGGCVIGAAEVQDPMLSGPRVKAWAELATENGGTRVVVVFLDPRTDRDGLSDAVEVLGMVVRFAESQRAADPAPSGTGR